MIIFNEINENIFQLDRQSLQGLVHIDYKISKMDIYYNFTNKYSIKEDVRGANSKFWIYSKIVPDGLLFKYPEFRNSSASTSNNYGELFVDLICHSLDVNHTNYYPCKFNLAGGETLIGTLSPSYKTSSHDTEFSGQNITTRYMQSQYDNNRGIVENIELNTIYGYLNMLKMLYSKWITKQDLSKLKHNMLELALIDFLTLQVDRHWGNFGFLNNSSKGMRTIKMIPIFDSGCSFCMNKSPEQLHHLYKAMSTNKNWKKHVVIPMATGKEYAPLLGIKTSLTQIHHNSALVNRKYNSSEPSNVEVFAEEMANEIIHNKDLNKLFTKAKRLDIHKLFKESGYFPDELLEIACNIWEVRLEILQKTIEDIKSPAKGDVEREN